MSADGLSHTDIDAVQDHLAMLRINEMVPTNGHILRRMVDAAPTDMNINIAQGTYFRGISDFFQRNALTEDGAIAAAATTADQQGDIRSGDGNAST